MTTTAMTTALPLLGLRISAGPVELRGITDDLLGPLAELAVKGIHDPGFMPFNTPWSLTPPAEMPRNMAQHHWRQRAMFSVAKWTAGAGTRAGASRRRCGASSSSPPTSSGTSTS